MRITELEIVNFRAVNRVSLERLDDVVVIAGPNGCGKSCILDAIRLVKSAYGGYQPNEWHNWFGEFQINFQQHSQELRGLLHDRTQPMRITASFSFAKAELDYIQNNARDLLRAAAWREVAPEMAGWRAFTTAPMSSQYRAHSEEVERRAVEAHTMLLGELNQASVTASITIDPGGAMTIQPSRLLELIFSVYEPGSVGVLDFHSAHRQYTRERVAGVNLDLDATVEQRRTSALYNPQQKYSGLKAEMASALVRSQLAQQAGAPVESQGDLISALKDLFQTFFPGKSFRGPVPTPEGRIAFPVELADGSTHDLDDLSSGEKEVLYGYMRLRSSAPRFSVILIDEPELHLNPRLTRGLARFYFDHLVAETGNQLWLISHSDALLREAINLDGFGVHHMTPSSQAAGVGNQMQTISTEIEAERLVVELVGDLAAYRPGAKVVLFEGGGNVEFDVLVVHRLFPAFAAATNVIAAGNRQQVLSLHRALDQLDTATLGARFYAIHDRDTDPEGNADANTPARVNSWDVYHIENYLLEDSFILRALRDLTGSDSSLAGVDDVTRALKDCAEESIPSLVRHEMLAFANSELRSALEVGADPASPAVAPALHPSVEGTAKTVARLAADQLSLAALEKRENDLRERYKSYLATEEWRQRFRGRDVLKSFVNRHVPGLKYEMFRDLVLARMSDAGYRPPGMESVLQAIVEDQFEANESNPA